MSARPSDRVGKARDRLERGLRVPSLTTIIRLAVALDCKVMMLVAMFDKADLRAMLPK